MKSIATVNFKGGVGKTTVSWLLAKYAAEKQKKRVLVIDTDAQMSLTLAVQLQESGAMVDEFEKWYDEHARRNKRSIFDAIDAYERHATGKARNFDFPIDMSFIYPMTECLHFIPSTVDLYWLELDILEKMAIKSFMPSLLGKIQHSKIRPAYDYVFFDCPPNFTPLSYSVLSCASLVLIPVNPDVFASRGIELMLDGLENRIQPWPNPCLAVFMNKAKLYRGSFTRETKRYWESSVEVCKSWKKEGVRIHSLSSFVPDRVDIKRAIPGGRFPEEFEESFASLWSGIEQLLT